MSNASSSKGGPGAAASSGKKHGLTSNAREPPSPTPTPFDDIVEAVTALLGDVHGEGNEEDDEAEGGEAGSGSGSYGSGGGGGGGFGVGGGSGSPFDVLTEDKVGSLSKDLFAIDIGSEIVGADKVGALRAHSFLNLDAKKTMKAKIEEYDALHVAELPKGLVAVCK
jgi:hypothetical protein